MSRTRRGGKGPGYEYWSRRPCNGLSPGKENKKLTHRLERRRAEIPEYEPEEPKDEDETDSN